MKKIILFTLGFFCLTGVTFASEAGGTLSTGVQTDGGLIFQLPCPTPSVSNGSVNTQTCAITCNSGYNLSGNSCVLPPSSGGGGGGGGGASITPTCSISYLECKQSLSGEYKYYVKSGMSCTAGELSKPCTPGSSSSSGSSLSSGSSSGITNTTNIIETLGSVNDNLQATTRSKTIQSYVTKLSNEITQSIDLPKVEIYATFDKDLNAKYQELLDTYQSMIRALDMYGQTKDKQYITQYQNLEKKYKSLLQELKDLDTRYVSKVMVNNVEIYKSRNEKLLPITNKIEKIILSKLNKKLKLKTITTEDYQKIITHYNYFVLQINIFKKFNLLSAKDEAKNVLKDLVKMGL